MRPSAVKGSGKEGDISISPRGGTITRSPPGPPSRGPRRGRPRPTGSRFLDESRNYETKPILPKSLITKDMERIFVPSNIIGRGTLRGPSPPESRGKRHPLLSI